MPSANLHGLLPEVICPETLSPPKQYLSPLRYPGGKSWLVPHFGKWLGQPVQTIVEPFVGGGSITLNALASNQAQRAVISEIDAGVVAFWQTMLGSGAENLIQRINEFRPTRRAVDQELAASPQSQEDRAWQILLKNRFSFGGILTRGASLLKRGENDEGFACRWYPTTLVNRIRYVHSLRERIEFRCEDGLDVLSDLCSRSKGAVCFADPPYPLAGPRLYAPIAFDHERLFALLSMWPGRFMLTYEDSEFVRLMAQRFDFSVSRAAMQARTHRHKYELIISNKNQYVRA